MYMNERTTRKIYDIWSYFYDQLFGSCVRRRQVRAVEQLPLRPGDRILDIGVGTGMLLPHYGKAVTVVGIDLSTRMLAKAERRRRDLNLTNCHLLQADAMWPPLQEASFDYIMMTHTISVVSDPRRLLLWAGRLLKPGGRIILLNHFQSTQPVMGWFEKLLNPFFVKCLGWKSDLYLEDLLGHIDMHVEYRFKTSLLDLWQIVVLSQAPAPMTAAPPPATAAHVPLNATLAGMDTGG